MDVAEDPECFNIVRQFTRFFKEYENHTRAKKARIDRSMPKVYIRYGDPATGKTRWMNNSASTDGVVCLPTLDSGSMAAIAMLSFLTTLKLLRAFRFHSSSSSLIDTLIRFLLKVDTSPGSPK